jgi:cytosine/creatinine deaminase
VPPDIGGIQMMSDNHASTLLSAGEQSLMDEAIAQARKSFTEGGLPIGSVLAAGDRLIAAGHNRRVQQGDPIAHGEMDCIRGAGRLRSYAGLTLFTTLSPCMMCTGTIVQFKIPRVIIGENQTFGGNEQFLRDRGVEVILMNDSRCIKLMTDFQSMYPEVWLEDIGEQG